MRIFVTPLVSGDVVVRGDEHHYLARVRRARAGDAIELVDGAGRRAAATITKIGDAETALAVGPIEDVVEPPPHVRVLVPLIKGDRMDSCIEKLVEVGADELVVWPAARSVVRLDDAARRDARVAHYQATAQAAARQSGRARVPGVTYAPSLAAALAALPAGGARPRVTDLPGRPLEVARVVLDPSAERAAFPAGDDLTIASGPEGGFAPDELDALAAAGFDAVGLGPSVLRADTAPVVAVAIARQLRV